MGSGDENTDVADAVEMETPGQESKKPAKKTHCHVFGEAHLRAFAWFFMILSQIGTIMFTMCKIYTGGHESESSSRYTALDTAGMVFSFFQFCFMPLTLTANFSEILYNQESFLPVLLKYGGGTFGVFVAYLFVYFRYVVKIIMRLTGLSLAEACQVTDMFLSLLFNYLRQLNFFVDLFVCTLIAFFILYKPKKVFTGKLIGVFRAMVAIPIAWSILGYIFLGLNDGGTVIPAYLYPLIPLKPPLFLIMFICLVFFIKIKEKRFVSQGHTKEEYKEYFVGPEFVQSFANFTAISLAICSVVDFALVFVTTPAMDRMGFGQGCLLFLVIPIILFFDFTKRIKSPIVSFLIPCIAVVIIIIMWIETGYWIAAWGVNQLSPILLKLFGSASDAEDDSGGFF